MAKKKFSFNFSNLTSLLLLGIVIVLIGVLFARFDPTTTQSEPTKNLKLFLFISARSGTFIEDTEESGRYTLTLQNTSPTVTYVSRNPDNYFGRVQLPGLVSVVWGQDSEYKFTQDAPNAILLVSNPETNQEDVTELELTDPQIQGSTIQFTATRPQGRASSQVKSFFDTNLTDFPPEFINPTLILDLSKSDVSGNMLEMVTAAENTPTN